VGGNWFDASTRCIEPRGEEGLLYWSVLAQIDTVETYQGYIDPSWLVAAWSDVCVVCLEVSNKMSFEE
jgi:hypothetical protein